MADYIPSDDAGLLAWATAFGNNVTAIATACGFANTFDDGFAAPNVAFSDALNDHNVAQSTARNARITKDNARKELVSTIREMVKQLQANPNLTDAQRATLGITIPDKIPTAVAAPTSRPVLSTDTSNRLQIGVKFTDESSPFSNAKPNGVDALELYMKIGDVAPASIADCQFVGNARKTPYIVNFDSADGGKKVHFLANWITRSGLRGAVSELTSTTIVA